MGSIGYKLAFLYPPNMGDYANPAQPRFPPKLWITGKKLWINALIWGETTLLILSPPHTAPPDVGVCFRAGPYVCEACGMEKVILFSPVFIPNPSVEKNRPRSPISALPPPQPPTGEGKIYPNGFSPHIHKLYDYYG